MSLASRLGVSRPVWLLGLVSLFTDMASEMVYPLLPIFLVRVIGAGAMSLGVIEGVAEAANSALKIGSGWLADRTGAPKKLVIAGYTLSGAARPLIALATAWPQVLAIRFGDRLGKGIRGAPRDAMLADFAPADARGRVFGFHRAMDHTGAVAGPLIASAFLYFSPGDYRTLFALTIVPGVIVILILLRVPEPSRSGQAPRATPRAQHPDAVAHDLAEARGARPSGAKADHVLPGTLWKALAVVFLFSLGNASDAFLLLRLSDLGVPTVWIPLLWSALHVGKVAASLGGGIVSDHVGRRTVIGLGWLWYAAVYAGFGYFSTLPAVVALFLAYGLYFGLTEGVEKAWVTDLVPAQVRGTAFGFYNAALGFGALAASLLFGLIWTRVSPEAAFLTGAGLAVSATVLLYFLFSDAKDSRH